MRAGSRLRGTLDAEGAIKVESRGVRNLDVNKP